MRPGRPATGRARAQRGSTRLARCRLPRDGCQRQSPQRCGPHATPRRDRRSRRGRGALHGTRETPASAHRDRARSPADQRATPLPSDHDPDRHDLRGVPRRDSRRAPRELQGVPADPEHLGAARASRRLPRHRNLARRCARTCRRRARGRRGHDRQPGGLRGLAPCRPGRAHRPRLRPLRRAAGRPARPVDLAAVRARRRRRPDARSRLGRRQGPDPPPRHGPRRPPGDARHPARQRALPLRGQRGGRRAAPAGVADREPRAPHRGRGRHQRHELLRRATCPRSRSACAATRTSRSTSRARRSTSTRGRTAGRSRTRPTRSPRSSPRSRVPTGGSASRASTTTSSA